MNSHSLPSLHSSFCRILIAVFAAFFGALSDNLGADAGITQPVVLAQPPPSAPQPVRLPEAFPYPVCGYSAGGLSVLDLCVMSALSYVRDDQAANETATWFQPAGKSVAQIADGRFKTGLRVKSFNVTGGPPIPPGGTVLVVTRGSKTAADIAQDISLWHEALLFHALSFVAPYGSFPTSLQQWFVGLMFSLTESITQGTDTHYFRDLVTFVQPLQANVSVGAARNATAPSVRWGVLYSAQAFVFLSAPQVILTGHSLGGGLSLLVGQKLGGFAVSFSSPGTLLTGYKLGVRRVRRRPLVTHRRYLPPLSAPQVVGGYEHAGVAVSPEYDIVPQADTHIGLVQPVR